MSKEKKYTFRFIKDWEDYKKGATVESDVPTSVSLFVGVKSPRQWTNFSVGELKGIIELL